MARGAHEIRTTLAQDMASFAEHHQVQKKLDEFYQSRIGIRMLIGQYLALRKPQVGFISNHHRYVISTDYTPYDTTETPDDDSTPYLPT